MPDRHFNIDGYLVAEADVPSHAPRHDVSQRDRLLLFGDERRSDYPDLLYRTVRDAINDACERVEQINQAGGGACPAEVARLIDNLGLLANQPAAAPATSWDALDRLFDLATVLLGLPDDGWRPPARRGRRAA